MGALIRAANWSQTTLGSPDQWPQSLRITINLLLTSRFPMFLWWGPQLVQFYNDAYRPSLGNEGKHPRALGQRGADCWEEIWPVIKPLIDEVLCGKGAVWRENQLIPIYRNGTLEDVYWTFSYSPVQDDNGKIAGVLVICQETTEHVRIMHHMEQKIEERTRELEVSGTILQQTNAELEQLIYVASHDLQEPLRKVLTFTEMLRKSLGNISDKSQNYFDRITASSGRMLNLVKEVLNFSQLSKKGLVFEQVDLNIILDHVKDDFELLISEKEASISSSPLPTVEGIPLQLNQLFSNLISNSLKFTAAGTQPVISITASLLPEAALEKYPFLAPQTPYYSIEFRDNGIGFEQEYGEQIFALFQRLHGKHEYSGTGIGLALCKKIVLNHQGHIYASSAPGNGSVFGVILPAVQKTEV